MLDKCATASRQCTLLRVAHSCNAAVPEKVVYPCTLFLLHSAELRLVQRHKIAHWFWKIGLTVMPSHFFPNNASDQLASQPEMQIAELLTSQ